jgi:hypothetical protein
VTNQSEPVERHCINLRRQLGSLFPFLAPTCAQLPRATALASEIGTRRRCIGKTSWLLLHTNSRTCEHYFIGEFRKPDTRSGHFNEVKFLQQVAGGNHVSISARGVRGKAPQPRACWVSPRGGGLACWQQPCRQVACCQTLQVPTSRNVTGKSLSALRYPPCAQFVSAAAIRNRAGVSHCSIFTAAHQRQFW